LRFQGIEDEDEFEFETIEAKRPFGTATMTMPSGSKLLQIYCNKRSLSYNPLRPLTNRVFQSVEQKQNTIAA
jgi:hypothetical protein